MRSPLLRTSIGPFGQDLRYGWRSGRPTDLSTNLEGEWAAASTSFPPVWTTCGRSTAMASSGGASPRPSDASVSRVPGGKDDRSAIAASRLDTDAAGRRITRPMRGSSRRFTSMRRCTAWASRTRDFASTPIHTSPCIRTAAQAPRSPSSGRGTSAHQGMVVGPWPGAPRGAPRGAASRSGRAGSSHAMSGCSNARVAAGCDERLRT